MLADQSLSTQVLELRAKRYLGIPVRESTLWLNFGDLLREGEVKGEERRLKEERLEELKEERDDLEQRVISMTSAIRQLQEELSE